MRFVGVHIQHALRPLVAIHGTIEVIAALIKQDGMVVLPLSVDKISDIVFSSIPVVLGIDGHSRSMGFSVFQRTIIHKFACFIMRHLRREEHPIPDDKAKQNRDNAKQSELQRMLLFPL